MGSNEKQAVFMVCRQDVRSGGYDTALEQGDDVLHAARCRRSPNVLK
jgi:hypothetical protein